MYTPTGMQMTNQHTITDFVRQFGFATLITTDLQASHLPLTLVSQEGAHGVLYGHLAKANAQTKKLDRQPVLVSFLGPHAYISPNWYQQKPAVPTWNYVAVHAYGVVELLDDDATAQAMTDLLTQYEPTLLQDQSVLPASFRKKLQTAVVGFRIVVTEWQGKEKLGQHRPSGDQLGVYTALQNSLNADARALASYMADRNLGIG